jgi:hypothetical protein
MGASAQGHIRKADGHMDIGGTIIPAYAINALLTDVPLVGQILTGGKGEGIFGLTYALKRSDARSAVSDQPGVGDCPGNPAPTSSISAVAAWHPTVPRHVSGRRFERLGRRALSHTRSVGRASRRGACGPWTA